MPLYPIKLSIVIPTFNREDLIGQTLQSVADQTSKPFEVIVVDNASTDKTSEIVKRYEKFGIKYHRNQTNLGMVGNYNKCIELATGDYVSFLHSDDLISPLWYETFEKIIKKHPADLYNCSSCVIDAKNIISYIFHTFPKNTFVPKSKTLTMLLKHDCPLIAPIGATVFSKTMIHKCTPFEPSLVTEADALVSMKAISQSNFYYIHKVLFGHRFHSMQTFDLTKHKKTDDDKLNRLKNYLNLVKSYSTTISDSHLRRLFITTHVFMSLCSVNLYLAKLQFYTVIKSNRIALKIFPDLYFQSPNLRQFIRIQTKMFLRAMFRSRKNQSFLPHLETA